MQVLLLHSLVLARRVSAQRQHVDLTAVEGTPPTYGTFDPIAGMWLEVFGREECLARLQSWPVLIPRPGEGRLPRSELTVEGERWLASVAAIN